LPPVEATVRAAGWHLVGEPVVVESPYVHATSFNCKNDRDHRFLHVSVYDYSDEYLAVEAVKSMHETQPEFGARRRDRRMVVVDADHTPAEAHALAAQLLP
jgi:hypothetical protein